MAVWLADGAGTDGAMQVADEGAKSSINNLCEALKGLMNQ